MPFCPGDRNRQYMETIRILIAHFSAGFKRKDTEAKQGQGVPKWFGSVCALEAAFEVVRRALPERNRNHAKAQTWKE